jgi:hypothetical protein
MRYIALLPTLLFYSLSLGLYNPDGDGCSICSPLEDCRLQMVGFVSQRLAITALCPNPNEYREQLPLNNSYIFSALYLDRCYGLSADKSSFNSINRNATDSLHDPEKNITAACQSTYLQSVKPDWSGGIQLTGNCSGHFIVTTLSMQSHVLPSLNTDSTNTNRRINRWVLYSRYNPLSWRPASLWRL